MELKLGVQRRNGEGTFGEHAEIVLGGGEIVGPRHWEEQSEDNKINLIN